MKTQTQTEGASPRLTVGDMLAENSRRRAAAAVDPISGEGLPGCRVSVTVEGLEPATQRIPAAMAADAFVGALVKAGSVDKFIKSLDLKPTDEERRHIVDKWDRTRIAHDFHYWAARYVRIKSKEGDIIPFRLNAPQRRLVEAFEGMRLRAVPIRLVLLKARQWGGSTATQLYMAWIQLVHRTGWNSLIIGHQSAATAEVNGMFELMMEHYPIELLVDLDCQVPPKAVKMSNLHGTTSTRVVPLRNARIKLGTAERPQSVRGGDSSMVHCTEVAFWKKTEGRTPTQMMKAATSGVLYRPLTMIVYESSANGVGNFFHSEYEAAKAGLSQFESLFVAWYEIEQYSLEFNEANMPRSESKGAPRFATARELARWMLVNRYDGSAMSERTVPGRYIWRLWERGATLEAINWYIAERTKYVDHADMASEFPSDDIEAFAHSGSRVFSLERLEQMRENCAAPAFTGDLVADAPSGPAAIKGLRFEPFDCGKLHIWEMPAKHDPDSLTPPMADRYVTTVDIGGRSPQSDWSVIHVLDRAPLAEGLPVATVAQWRGHVDMDLLAWKAAQIAAFYGNSLLVIESNTVETTESDRWVDGDQSPYLFIMLDRVYPNIYYRANGRPGFHTNIVTKPMVISTLVQAVRDGLLVERSQECIDEFCCYERRPDGSFGAIAGKHDDMLMTRAIGLHIAVNELTPPSAARRPASCVRGNFFDNH